MTDTLRKVLFEKIGNNRGIVLPRENHRWPRHRADTISRQRGANLAQWPVRGRILESSRLEVN